MTELPLHLRPWRAELAIFPPDLALVLGELVTRLGGLLGAEAVRPRTRGPVSGYDGISRRGSYERLLMSEWALLSEAPDEFLRRAANAEHSFVRLAHQAGSAEAKLVLLLDTGPDQLGAPRIAGLALLVLLAARARAMGGTFSWSSIMGEGELTTGLDEPGVRAFLAQRTHLRPTPDALTAWSARLAEAPCSEIYLASSSRLEAAASDLPARFVAIEEVLEVMDGRHLSVALHRPGARKRELVLRLPAERHLGTLLRNPFAARTPVLHAKSPMALAIDPAGGLLFSDDERRLFARGEGPSLVVFQVPNSPRAIPGHPFAFGASLPSEEVLLAVGLDRKRRVVGAWRRHDGSGVVVRHASRRGGSVSAEYFFEGEFPAALGGAGLGPLLEGAPGHLALVTSIGAYELNEGKAVALDLGPAQAQRFAWVGGGRGLMWVSGEAAPKVTSLRFERGSAVLASHVDGEWPALKEEIFFGPTLPRPRAWSLGRRTFRVEREGKRSLDVRIPDGFELCGVTNSEQLLRHADGCGITLKREGQFITLLTTTEPIVAFGYGESGAAALSAGGELILARLDHAAVTWRGVLPRASRGTSRGES